MSSLNQLSPITPYQPSFDQALCPTVESAAEQLKALSPQDRIIATKLAKLSNPISSILEKFEKQVEIAESDFRVKLHSVNAKLHKIKEKIDNKQTYKAKKLFAEAKDELYTIHAHLISDLSGLDYPFTQTRQAIRNKFDEEALRYSSHSAKKVELAQNSLTGFLNHSLGLVQALETKLLILGRQLGETSLLPSATTSLKMAFQEIHSKIEYKSLLTTALKTVLKYSAGATILYAAWQEPTKTPSVTQGLAFTATVATLTDGILRSGKSFKEIICWTGATFFCRKNLRNTADWIFTNLSPYISPWISPNDGSYPAYHRVYEHVANHSLLYTTVAYAGSLALYRLYQCLMSEEEEDTVAPDHAYKAWERITPKIPPLLPPSEQMPVPLQTAKPVALQPLPPIASPSPAPSTQSQLPSSRPALASTSPNAPLINVTPAPSSSSSSPASTPGQPPSSKSKAASSPTSSQAPASTPGQPPSITDLATSSSSSTLPAPSSKRQKNSDPAEKKRPLDTSATPASTAKPPKVDKPLAPSKDPQTTPWYSSFLKIANLFKPSGETK